jgi:urease accessory protein
VDALTVDQMKTENFPAAIFQQAKCLLPLTIAAIVLTSESASAHLIDPTVLRAYGSFVVGLSHPVLGFDHFLAMFSVGFISALLGGKHFWRVPACFVATIPFGWIIGRFHWPFPPVELGIAVSVIALGAAAVWTRRIPLLVTYSFVVIFALFHGYAHGVETPVGLDPVQFMVGFLVGTAAIHVLGLFAGDMLHRPGQQNYMERIVGAAVMIAGLAIATLKIV